ncbi:MAG: DUF1707 domain-containing protein [Pseudonocardiales bacterium]|nr:DUF1707 domain-containing protein [Actinomycetota bacterium]
MSSPPDPAPEIRIGNDERESATKALDAHLNAGRLDPDEYADRMVQVSVARTFADLMPLFVDLPAPHPTWPVATEPVALTKAAPGAPAARQEHGREPLGGRLGETFVALSPFIAIALFFLLRFEWPVFLLIPIAGAVVYGGRRNRR